MAQTLINILPNDDTERQLLEGFLAGREVLPEVAKQDRCFSAQTARLERGKGWR